MTDATSCKSCHREIRFITTENGKEMPVDGEALNLHYAPDDIERPKITAILPNGKVITKFVTPEEGESTQLAWSPHWATCTQPDAHRTKIGETASLFQPPNPDARPDWLYRKFSVFDTETTGLDVKTARVVQIAVLNVTVEEDNTETSGEWKTLVRQDKPIPKKASEVHGITADMCEDAPTFAEAWEEARSRLKGGVLMAYNGISYDVPLLNHRLADIGLGHELPADRVLDPLVLARKFHKYDKGKTLTKMAERYGCRRSDAHDALADCWMCWGVFIGMVIAEPEWFIGRKLGHLVAGLQPMKAEQDEDYRLFKASRRA